jgi:hypothetical protein
MGKAARRQHRLDRRSAEPLVWPRVATVTVLGAALLVGIGAWLLLKAVAPGLFTAESSINGSSPATFVVAAIGAAVGAMPTLLYWKWRLTRERGRSVRQTRK